MSERKGVSYQRRGLAGWREWSELISLLAIYTHPCVCAHTHHIQIQFLFPSLSVSLSLCVSLCVSVSFSMSVCLSLSLSSLPLSSLPLLWFYRAEIRSKVFPPGATMRGSEGLTNHMRFKCSHPSLTLASLSTRDIL